MRFSTRTSSCAAAALVLAGFGFSAPASAACTRLAFSVNDYGKDGPTADAKRLLDKYIAKWTAERGISKYTTGKKEVTCELFLNLILFDEHTCKAEASVCWDGAPASSGAAHSAGANAAPEKSEAESKAVVKSTPVKAAPAEAESDDSETAKAATGDTAIETGSTEKAPETITAKPESSEPSVAPTTPESDEMGGSEASEQSGADQGAADQP